MAKDLISSLQDGIVLIRFQSLNSGKEYEREYTLSDKYIPNKLNNQSGDKLICYDVEFKKWEDIEVSTILNWTKVV
jgi:hypothetical protein|tara:strand:+ start:576 stop:803 length:228 start_codon:yes stop_codon:yes gene_type:complete